jgi:hypothetical protein
LWHQVADRVAGRDDLAHREIDVDVGLKVDLFDTDAGQNLRLDVPHVVDARADRIFAVGRYPLLHFFRREARVLPDQRDDGDVDPRKDILGRAQDRARAKHQHGQRHDIERMRIFQSKAYDPHQDLFLDHG